MALDFPSSPSLNQIISSEGLEYIWNGTAWVGYSSEISYPQANLTNIDAVNIDVTGITTSVNLDVTNGTIDYLSITQANVSGTTTSLNLDVTNGTIDYFTATHSNVSGVSSATNLDVTNGTIDYFTATQANVSGTTTSLNVDVTNGTVDYLTATQANVSGIVTATTFDGNVTGDVLGNLTGNVNSSGVSTFSNVVVGGATTDLVVVGDARITGILTIGTSSITLDGNDNTIKIGTGLTLTAAGGANYSGIVTALAFFGDGTNIDISSNPNNGVGLGTIGGIVGYAVTQLNLFGTGISTSFATSGIATVYINSGNVPIGNTFPSSPKNGDLFYNIDYGRTYIYYDEVALGVGLAAFWVDAAPFNNIIEANYALVAGISTYASVAGVATVAQNLTGGPNVQVGRIRATGITTFERDSEFQKDVRIDGTLRVGTGVTINSGVVTATSFTRYGGTSSQFLKADGSVDSSTYLTSAPESYWVSTAAGINTSSNVGIGTTAKSGISLDTPGPVRVQKGSNKSLVSSAGFTVDGPEGREIQLAYNTNPNYILNNIGIGTTNPTSALTVVGSGASLSQLYVTGVSTFGSTINANGNINLNSSITEVNFTDLLSFFDSNGDGYIVLGSSSVTLAYADKIRLETIGAGVTVTGTTFTNQLSVSGVSTFGSNINANGNINLNSSGTDVNFTDYLSFFDGVGDGYLILGNSSVRLAYADGVVLETIGTGVTVTGTTFTNQLSVSGVSNLKQITETVANAFTTTLSPSAGTLTIDTSVGTVVLGDLNASVTTWAFTNVPTTNSKATTVTVIIDGDTADTYGDACSVNGSAVSGGVKWSGGSAPTATDNFDIITFTIVKDSAGTINVFGSSNTNFS